MKYVIIGNSAAGLSAAKEIRSKDIKGSITIIGREDFPAYGRPMISYYLKDKVSLDKLPIHDEQFYKDNDIKVIIDSAEALDLKGKKVKTGANDDIPYDKLILATGSVPFVPPINNLKSQSNVYTFLDVANAKALKAAVNQDTRVVILGGGLIALKAAEGLRGITSNISVVELADRILPTILNKESSEVVRAHIEKQGIKFYLADTISEVKGDNKIISVVLKSGVEIPADIFVVAVGVRPEVKLAKDAGITVNRGIVINSRMQTSAENVYAAGDCVETLDTLDGATKIIALWPQAVVGGKLAGANAAGEKKEAEGAFPFNAIDFFGLRMITGGIINPPEGYKTVSFKDDRGYSTFVIKNDKLFGYMLIGDVERAGLFTDIIRNGYKLSGLKNVLKSREFLSFESELRSLKYRGLI
jgi:NAD(P)H-nitrite reductase large subunit